MHSTHPAKTRAAIWWALCLLLYSPLMAEPVGPDQVRETAGGFLRQHRTQTVRRTGLSIAASREVANIRAVRDANGAVLAYIAALEPRGFIAMSADTDLAPIIAYSFRSGLSPDAATNPLCRMLKEDLRRRTQALAEYPEHKKLQNHRLWGLSGEPGGAVADETFQQWPPENTTSTGGWVETTWHQDTPYNDLCPLDAVDEERSYVGCVATALALVVDYHQVCSARFSESDSYTTRSGIDIDAESERYDFPSFTELNTYLAGIQSKYEAQLPLSDRDASALSFACGVAVQMNFTSEGSGASPSDLHDALLYKFGFGSGDMTGGLSCETYPVLQENLINGLPALFGTSYPDGVGGHLIVCDGYNTHGEYHLNFGWGSESPDVITEAWYRLPEDMPTKLIIIDEAILNVRPDRSAIDVEPAWLLFHSLPGQASQPQTLRITNHQADVTINSISSPEGFLAARPDGAYSNRIEPFGTGAEGQETLVSVIYAPDEAGATRGVLTIDYDDGRVRHVMLNGCAFTGGTEIPGGEVFGRWSKAQSPYFVSGDIAIAQDTDLAIDPGVQVLFTGPYGMTVGHGARLIAMGTENEPVEFTAWNRDLGWRGLRFVESGDDDIVRHCSITFSKKGSRPDADNGAGTGVDEDADRCGGAVYCYRSAPTIVSCKITNNTGDRGGAIYCEESSPVISNTLIANNTSMGGRPQCGGICTDVGGIAQLNNCTIVNNVPGGIFGGSWDGLDVTNTIIWGNHKYQIETYRCAPRVSFCDVQEGYRGDGNIDADPCFLAPASGVGIDYDGSAARWTLTSRSPCINMGIEHDLTPTDLAGNLRVHSDVVDIGAYENQSDLPLITLSPSATVDAGFVRTDSESVTALEIRNTGRQDVEIDNVSILDANDIFFIVTPVSDCVLPPGDAVVVEIGFAPKAEQPYTGTLDIDSTSTNGAQVPVSLRGVGVFGTVVPGGPVSGTWTRADSPLAVTGDIYVPAGLSLTIEPGVVVKFAGHFGLTVGYAATLEAAGTEDEHIVFTATNAEEGWFGIRFVDAGYDDVLQHCTIEHARKPSVGGGGFLNIMGGAILCCTSEEATPDFYVPSSPVIDHCLIAHNHGDIGGGIMCADGSEALIVNCTITDNSTEMFGGGIFLYGAFATVGNNIIAHNSGVVSGGISNWYGLSSIINNTIVHNRPNGLHLETTEMRVWGRALVLNNIIWQNEMYVEESVSSTEYDIRFNDIQGGWSDQGNLDADPHFADPGNRDYHLQSVAGRWDPQSRTWVSDNVSSPCIDAGHPDAPVGEEPVPHGDRVNMGAYGGLPQASKSP